MRTIEQFFDSGAITVLQSLVGSEWRMYGSEEPSPELDDAIDDVFVETSASTIIIRVGQVMLNLDGEPDGYAALSIEKGQPSAAARRIGNISAIFSGQRIKEVYLLESEVHEVVEGEPSFTFRAHDGVVFELDPGWVGISKYGIFADQISISTVVKREDLDLYDALGPWTSDLEVRYSGSSNLVPVGERLP